MSKNKEKIKISFVGNNSTQVTGSCTLIEIGNKLKGLVECGLIQGNHSLLAEYKINNRKFSFKPKEISFVFIGHAHVDHIGLLPKLVKDGFNGEIIVPKGNFNIMKELLLDCTNIMEKDAYDISKKTKKECFPIYEKSHVLKVLELIKEYDFGVKHELSYKDENNRTIIEFQFLGSSHIINSAQILLWIRNGNNIKKIGFTSDIGNISNKQYYVNEFEPIQNANVLVAECTYCNEKRGKKKKDRDKDLEKIKATIIDTCIERKGSVLIPVFALHRLEVMLTVLWELFKDYEGFDIPIVISSPLGRKIMGIYVNDLRTNESQELEQSKYWQRVLMWPNIILKKDFDDLEALINEYQKENKPAIYLSPGGFLQAGHSVYILKRLLPSAKNSIIFCGFSTPDSLAGKIKAGKQKTVTIDGKPIRNSANVINLNSFSSHMQYNDLLNYYSSGNFEKICLVHGDFDDKIEFAKILQDEVSKKNKTSKVVVVNKGTSINL